MDRPEFHRLAEYELNEAAQYYDLEEPGLGAACSSRRLIGASSPSRLPPKPERSLVEPSVAGFSVDFRTRSSTRSSRVASVFSR
jgi:hypothetical protein